MSHDLVTLEALVDASHPGILQIPAQFVERRPLDGNRSWDKLLHP